MPDTTNTLLFVILVLLVALLVVFVKLLRRPPAISHFDRAAPPATTPSLQPPDLPASDGVLDLLTPRERDVAMLAARGLTNRQIAGELGLSINTVSNHLKRVYAKLGVRSRAEMSWRLQYLDLHAGAPPDVLD